MRVPPHRDLELGGFQKGRPHARAVVENVETQWHPAYGVGGLRDAVKRGTETPSEARDSDHEET